MGVEYTDPRFEDDVKLVEKYSAFLKTIPDLYQPRIGMYDKRVIDVRPFFEMMHDTRDNYFAEEHFVGLLSKDNYAFNGSDKPSESDKKSFGPRLDVIPSQVETLAYGRQDIKVAAKHFPGVDCANWKFPENYPDWCRAVSEFCINNHYDDIILGNSITFGEQLLLMKVMVELWDKARFPEIGDEATTARELFIYIRDRVAFKFTREYKDTQWEAADPSDIPKYNDTLARLRYMELCTLDDIAPKFINRYASRKIMGTLDEDTKFSIIRSLSPDTRWEYMGAPALQDAVVRHLAESSHATHKDDSLLAFCPSCQDEELAKVYSDEEMD